MYLKAETHGLIEYLTLLRSYRMLSDKGYPMFKAWGLPMDVPVGAGVHSRQGIFQSRETVSTAEIHALSVTSRAVTKVEGECLSEQYHTLDVSPQGFQLILPLPKGLMLVRIQNLDDPGTSRPALSSSCGYPCGPH